MNSTERDLPEDKLLPCPFCGTSLRRLDHIGAGLGGWMHDGDPDNREDPCRLITTIVYDVPPSIAAWNRRTPADALASIRAELEEARADKARVDELLTAAVDDYDETLAERDMAERAAVEAAIPLEALLMAGQGPLSDAVWDGVRNGVGHVRSMLKARAARTIAGEQKP